jgi:hypothetical protein
MNSITAAKNRRVNPPSSGLTPPQNTYVNKNPQPPPIPGSTNSTNKDMNSALTLPQVIKLVDIRLTNLEKSVTEIRSSSNGLYDDTKVLQNKDITSNLEFDSKLKEVIDEFDKRYEMLAQEVVELKDIVLRLQTYTMDVNKMLIEERSQIMEELGKKEQENLESSPQIISET